MSLIFFSVLSNQSTTGLSLSWNSLATPIACSKALILVSAFSVRSSNLSANDRRLRSIPALSAASQSAATSRPIATKELIEPCLSNSIFFKNFCSCS
uniref:Uncharacterized protein n=1 Tax=Panstrongylus lignarius TaxID=156445 RepID=A0A224Y380_9HEMI